MQIESEAKRKVELGKLGHIEKTIALDGRAVTPLDDEVSRTDANGKTSAVHFLSVQDLHASDIRADSVLSCSHAAYPHTVQLGEALAQELRKDFID